MRSNATNGLTALLGIFLLLGKTHQFEKNIFPFRTDAFTFSDWPDEDETKARLEEST